MGIFSDFFKKIKGSIVYIGGYGTRSQRWIRDIAQQDICTSILDCNATHVAKAQVLHVVVDQKGRVEKIDRSSNYSKLFQSPNPLMSGFDFLYALSWQLDEKNTALAWIEWDEQMEPKNIWPIAYQNFDIYNIIGGGYAVKFTDFEGCEHALFMDDMVILRRHFDGSAISGRGNGPVTETIEMVQTLDDGLSAALAISNKIHGILKQKKSMLSPEHVTSSQKDFVNRLKNAAASGGIITTDASEDYMPLTPNAWAANAAQTKQITDRLYRYWRTPMEVVDNTASEQVMQNYYDSIIEPRWQAMSTAFTEALFSNKEKDGGNRIMLFGGAATGSSWATKLSIISSTKEFGLLTINEYRELLGYAPTEDGDERLVSLNYIKSADMSKYQTGKEGDENAVQA